VRKGVLEACALTRKAVLPSELERCAVSDKRVLKTMLGPASVSEARLQHRLVDAPSPASIAAPAARGGQIVASERAPLPPRRPCASAASRGFRFTIESPPPGTSRSAAARRSAAWGASDRRCAGIAGTMSLRKRRLCCGEGARCRVETGARLTRQGGTLRDVAPKSARLLGITGAAGRRCSIAIEDWIDRGRIAMGNERQGMVGADI